jgi:hypothetical protein
MTAIDLNFKLDLIIDKIENVERSGKFTENEIDRTVPILYMEKELYLKHLNQILFDIEVNDPEILANQTISA